jgi:hypothetical protein
MTPPNVSRSAVSARTLEQTRAADSALALLSERDLVLVDAVARRVLDMLDERNAAQTAGRLVDASTLARMLGVSRSTVYAIADELGAVRLGGGSKPRLRFDPERARAAMSCSLGKRSHEAIANDDGRSTPSAARGPHRLPSRLPKPGSVLAVRGREAA